MVACEAISPRVLEAEGVYNLEKLWLLMLCVVKNYLVNTKAPRQQSKGAGSDGQKRMKDGRRPCADDSDVRHF